MSADNKSLRASNRLDAKVFLTLAIVTVISLAVFGFRFATTPRCKNLTLVFQTANSTDANTAFTGTPVRFSCNATKDDNCEWAFGTKDNKTSSGQFVTFSYSEPGQYLVELTVNGVCHEFKFINILKAPKIINSLQLPKIICPVQMIEIGKPVTFKDSTADAKSWEWRFGESEKVDATTKEATYTFKTTGFKTVTLIVNGKPESYATCQVFVNEKAAAQPKTGGDIMLPPIDDKPKSDPLKSGNKVTISDDDFNKMMEQVVHGVKYASDFAPYLCGGNLQIPVNYKVSGSKEKVMSFELVCRDLEEMKTKKIRKVTISLQRDPGTNCINGMTINVDRKHGIL
jgi:PKD repeat protein